MVGHCRLNNSLTTTVPIFTEPERFPTGAARGPDDERTWPTGVTSPVRSCAASRLPDGQGPGG